MSSDSAKEVWPCCLASLSLMTFLLFMEWLFFVTKPSFLSGVRFEEKIAVFLVALIYPALCILVLFGFLKLLLRISQGHRMESYLRKLLKIPPWALMTLICFLLIDNFTYSLVRFGVFSFSGAERLIYLFVFLGMVWLARKPTLDLLHWLHLRHCQNLLGFPLLGVYVVATCLCVYKFHTLTARGKLVNYDSAFSDYRLPNIIILTADGVSAEHMSLYGYARPTTPNLEGLSKDLLVFENAFSNCVRSAGSIVSMLTGRNPLETGVINFPDIVKQEESFQHLPGMLKALGYRNLEVTARYYADSFDLNLRDGFDIVNFRKPSTYEWPLISHYQELYSSLEYYFLVQTYDRIVDRLRHIFFLANIHYTYEEMTESGGETSGDKRSLNYALTTIEGSREPVFAHMHLFGTHGPRFSISNPIFSKGKVQAEENEVDFYDDAIREFDELVGDLFKRLEETGEIDNTLIVINSDHSAQNKLNQRIPLVMYSPDKLHTGRVSLNVSLLDVAPTILGYIGALSEAFWMEGKDLLSEDYDRLRPVLGVADTFPINVLNFKSGPYKNVAELGLVVCDRGYIYRPSSKKLTSKKVPNYVGQCRESDYPKYKEVVNLLSSFLESSGLSK